MVTELQLSLATVPVATSGTAASQLPSAEALPPAGTVFVVTPRPTGGPATGLSVMVPGLRLSLAAVPVAASGTARWQLSFPAGRSSDGTEVIEGAVVSLMVKVVVLWL